MSDLLTTTIPQYSVPFVDQNGQITRPWLYFLLGLKSTSSVIVDIIGITDIAPKSLVANSGTVAGVPSSLAISNDLTITNGSTPELEIGASIARTANVLPASSVTTDFVITSGTLGAAASLARTNGTLPASLASGTYDVSAQVAYISRLVTESGFDVGCALNWSGGPNYADANPQLGGISGVQRVGGTVVNGITAGSGLNNFLILDNLKAGSGLCGFLIQHNTDSGSKTATGGRAAMQMTTAISAPTANGIGTIVPGQYSGLEVYCGASGNDNGAPTVVTAITSGTYNTSTGLVTLNLASSINTEPSDAVYVSGATGTGSVASINGGPFAVAAGTALTSISYTIATGLTMTIAGGNVQSGGVSGTVFGSNVIATIGGGATYYNGLIGIETGQGIDSTSSALANIGLHVTLGGQHAVSGSQIDCAIGIDSGGALGWGYGLQFNNPYKPSGFSAQSILIGSKPCAFGSVVVTSGIDLTSGFTFTSSALALPGLNVGSNSSGIPNVLLGNTASLAATATQGFPQIPTLSAAPTGAAADGSECLANVSGSLRRYSHINGAWHYSALT